ncbi:MAG: ABC transporter ATP-binding protein [Planctomycetota bacterium]|mgnify:CR=1 FL=1
MEVEIALRASRLTKRFGEIEALRGVDLSLSRGEVLGVLGPNGAGKSTTMKILTGYLTPDAGTVTVCGVDQSVDPLRCRSLIGYLPEELPLYLDMMVADYLDHIARLKSIPGPERRRAVTAAMASADCAHNERRRIRGLSKGNRQRIGLAGALLGDPPVLILDEPTSGLDPSQVANFRDLIRGLASRHAILLSTHVLGEVDAVCDHVVVIHRGQTVLSGPIGELRSRAARVARVSISLRSGDAQALCAAMAGMAWAQINAGDQPGHITVDADPARRAELVALAEANGGLRELTEERVPLEVVFRELVAGS